MQVILRTTLKFAQLGPGDTFGCSVRSAPYLMIKDSRGFAVVLQNGEVCEISPEEACYPISGLFIEAGAVVGGGAHAPGPSARVGQDAQGNVTAELRGTLTPGG